MGKQRQNWSVEEKLATVLAVLSERQSVAEVARRRGVNENQAHRWKERFLEGGCQGLNGANSQAADRRLEAENHQLKRLLGEKALGIEIWSIASPPPCWLTRWPLYSLKGRKSFLGYYPSKLN